MFPLHAPSFFLTPVSFQYFIIPYFPPPHNSIHYIYFKIVTSQMSLDQSNRDCGNLHLWKTQPTLPKVYVTEIPTNNLLNKGR